MKLKFYLCKEEEIIKENTSIEDNKETEEETSEVKTLKEPKLIIKKKPIFICDTDDIDVSMFGSACNQDFLKEKFNESDLAELQLTDIAYSISLSDIKRISKNKGFVSGYAQTKEIKAYYEHREENDETRFAHYEMEIIPIETYVDFDDRKRKMYEKFSFLDTYSKGYLYNILNNILFDADEKYTIYAFTIINSVEATTL